MRMVFLLLITSQTMRMSALLAMATKAIFSIILMSFQKEKSRSISSTVFSLEHTPILVINSLE
ncbi:MAG: hypothetical protein CMO80_23290 [Verrucomicrobiales bacterium]|nr:hypothetical protein [Verrucomicrobiales bacterium]